MGRASSYDIVHFDGSLWIADTPTSGAICYVTDEAKLYIFSASWLPISTAIPDATTTTKGVASFAALDFSVSSGAVSLNVHNVAWSTITTTTQAVDDIATDGGTFNGTITNIGWWIDNYGFEWKEGLGGDVTSITVGTSQSVTTFDYVKTGLNAGTTYYVRTWGYNEAGKGYGSWVEFTTESAVPVVTTQGASVPVAVPNPAYYEWATGNGTIVSGEKITDRGFEIVVEFSGDLYDSIQHSIAGFEGTASWDWDAWAYVGTLTKTETEDIGFGGYFEAEAYDMELGNFPAIIDKLFVRRMLYI